MEGNFFTVSIKIGLQMRFEFDGMMLSYDEKASVFTFCESKEGVMPVENGGMIVINLSKRSIAFSKNGYYMVLDIERHKKVGDNYHFKCATDLCRVDVYICDRSVWKEKNETIFS